MSPAVFRGTVTSDGAETEYLRFGSGERTLVILPGLSVQSVVQAGNAVASAYRLLAERFTIYLPDRRKNMPDVYGEEEMARDTLSALRALGLKNVSLFGVSQGGMLAMRIAIEAPEFVEKLILGSTAARVTEEGFGTIERWIGLANAGNAAELYLDFGEAVYPKDVFEASKEMLVEIAKSVTKEDLRRFSAGAAAVRGHDVTGRLSEITCPVLVIGSRDDRVLGGESSEELAAHLNRAELYMYNGYGHAAYDTAPDYKERMLKFLLPEAEH